MSFTFNADEIFQIAIQMERNGGNFYRKAAEKSEYDKAKQILLGLATMEDRHEEMFTEMRAELGAGAARPVTFDPDDQAALYLEALVDGKVFNYKSDPWEGLTGNESLADILEISIGLEQDAIVFYLGIYEVVPPELGRDKIQDIIREEMGHITALHKQLLSL